MAYSTRNQSLVRQSGELLHQDEALGNEIAELAALIDSATAELLRKIRAFDESEEWFRQGALSCAAWLSWRLGYSAGVAREKVRVARALANLPATEIALARGELSYSKVRAMTRIACPANEEALLEQARHATTAQLETICRLYRGATGPQTEREWRDARWVRSRDTDDGMVRITMNPVARRSRASPYRDPRRRRECR